jgi:hypothetical protein
VITAGAEGPGQGTVYYTVRANTTTSSRNGAITIADGVTHTVTQGPAPPPCTYSISPPDRNFEPAGGAGTITVTAGDGCEWSASSDRDWIQITDNSDTGSGDGTVSYRVLPNNTTYRRDGAITLNDEVTHAVSQGGDGTDPEIEITSPTEDDTYLTRTSTLNIGGWARDNVGVDDVLLQVVLGDGQIRRALLEITENEWSASIELEEGENRFSVTARDAAGNTDTDTLTVTYRPLTPTAPTLLSGVSLLNNVEESTYWWWIELEYEDPNGDVTHDGGAFVTVVTARRETTEIDVPASSLHDGYGGRFTILFHTLQSGGDVSVTLTDAAGLESNSLEVELRN